MEAFPGMLTTATGAPVDDGAQGGGDDLLDALLGLDVSGATALDVSTMTSGSGLGGDIGGNTGFGGLETAGRSGGDARKSFSEVAAAAAAGGGDDDGGDSLLDALLGLEVGTELERDTGGGAFAVSAPAEEAKEKAAASTGASGAVGAAGADAGAGAAGSSEGVGRAGDGEGGRGPAVQAPPPFEGAELGRLCKHLNDRNRRAKRLAQRCQEMFLRLFFKVAFVSWVGWLIGGSRGFGW